MVRLVVGIADVMPRLLAMRLVRPVLMHADDVRIQCRTGSPSQLIEELALHRVHVVLSDAPAAATDGADRIESHLVGRCGIVLFAAPELAARYRAPMPRVLDGAPFLLPGPHTEMRRAVDRWFVARKVRRRIVEEKFADIIAALYDGSDMVSTETEVTYEDVRKGKIKATLTICDAEVVPVVPQKVAAQ